jgi:uncharacterized protein (TIGR02145 family)
MKRVVLSIMIVLMCILINAQVPEYFNYQAIVRDDGEVIQEQTVSLLISIIRTSTSGTTVYSEKHTPTTNEFGLVNIAIGSGDIQSGNFSTIDWGADIYFLNVKIDASGGTSYSDIGTTQLLSVPYALYAKTSEKANELELKLHILTNSIIAGGMVVDIEGNSYKTVRIGTQVWMAENLKTTKYRNGDIIETTNPANLIVPNDNTSKYQWAYDGNESNVATYGRLYTWYAATDNRNVCPTDWHVPSDAEWTTLATYLGGDGGKLKETGTIHWQSPNAGATDESDFTALPGGHRDFNFWQIGNYFECWTATEKSESVAWLYYLYYGNSSINLGEWGKNMGMSVRCLKDN